MIILLLLIHAIHTLFAQDFSNKGKDFWIGYGNHVRMFNAAGPNQYEKMQLYITSDINTVGKVEIASVGFSQNFTITANQITTIDIPRSAALMDQGLYDHGIHVTAQKPIVVYSFIYVNAISGATVCLPTETLGKEYFSVNYSQAANEQNAHSYFFVIAADEGTTTVEITPSADTKIGQPAGVPFTVDLKQGQIYQVLGKTTGQTGVDLTGSKIRSISNNTSGCKKIAVFCGSGKIKIGANCDQTSDNLYQQMYPKATWGKKYIAVPGLGNANNYFRICKSDPTATVWLNGNQLTASSFINNFYYDFLTKEVSVIESDKPILVAQYFTTQNCEGNPKPGDPDMIYLNPVEQTISRVTLNSMQPVTGTNIQVHYLNFVLKNNKEAINSFKVDGSPFTNFNPVPNDSNYVYGRMSVSSGTHNIVCDTGFNIISYGFGEAESYGYSGGTNLKDLYQFVSIKNQYATVDFPAGCRNSPFNFSMVLPYKPTQLEWKFNGLFPDTLIIAPGYDSTWMVNGRQLYRFKIEKPYTIYEIGSYPIKIIAQNPTPEGCSGVQEIDYVLEIFEKPKAQINTEFSGCFPDSTYFTDVSILDRPVSKRLWNFGDGNISQVKSPVYKYKAPGTYTAYYNLITDIGCLSDTASKIIEVNPAPVAMFDLLSPFCKLQDITISDSSSVSSGSITGWLWKMGNADSLVKKDNASFKYRYNTIGDYRVSLIVESDKGCKSQEVSRQINVGAVPNAGFITPGNCIKDPFSQFIDSSSIEDNSESAFSYTWNFGDANAGSANPNFSTQKNPLHKYTATGEYSVSLVVNTPKGCADTIQQKFYINGAKPNASIAFKNGLEFCSNKNVSFTNESGVDVGKLIRLEVFWDYNYDPKIKTIDSFPFQSKTYQYNYQEFFSPEIKSTNIMVFAYSGQNCLDSTSQIISLKATPKLVFDPLSPVCANEGPLMITQARNTNSLSGNGAYSGLGITTSGKFYPDKVKSGIDSIAYTFTADNGCSNVIKNTIEVFPAPMANAGPDLDLLEGKGIFLQGRGMGRELSYAWTPDFYLNKSDTAQPFATPGNDQYYTLTVKSRDGCKDDDVVFVKVLKKPLIPNAFSPNGDGMHDRWEIKYLDSYPEATVEVYNRYGELVYKSIGSSKPWDGTFKGNPVPVGTYYYLVNPKRGRQQMSGFVDVIR
ncbi:PKD domain-containing protein [Paraflavisolibacter caeni]|uniref:PKD domain-containing protein n=1 Tax=Paraflavisolibacter caeni TaxID=2982496 RepID=UPI0024337A6E|nr:PKD domain-containing protein [Paraflavisolibacter caeni]